VLVNGCLSVGDKIVIAGQEGAIVTRIREIRIPESNQELRVTVNEPNSLLNLLDFNLESISKT
jgi:translation initiation factor IF-2